eukprot:2760580-Pyramimonas_sp.AAC.1
MYEDVDSLDLAGEGVPSDDEVPIDEDDDDIEVVVQSGKDVLTTLLVPRGTPAFTIYQKVVQLLNVPWTRYIFILANLDKGFFITPDMEVTEPLRLRVQKELAGG